MINTILKKKLKKIRKSNPESYETMLMSEEVLKKDWDNKYDDEAWKDL